MTAYWNDGCHCHLWISCCCHNILFPCHSDWPVPYGKDRELLVCHCLPEAWLISFRHCQFLFCHLHESWSSCHCQLVSSSVLFHCQEESWLFCHSQLDPETPSCHCQLWPSCHRHDFNWPFHSQGMVFKDDSHCQLPTSLCHCQAPVWPLCHCQVLNWPLCHCHLSPWPVCCQMAFCVCQDVSWSSCHCQDVSIICVLASSEPDGHLHLMWQTDFMIGTWHSRWPKHARQRQRFRTYSCGWWQPHLQPMIASDWPCKG